MCNYLKTILPILLVAISCSVQAQKDTVLFKNKGMEYVEVFDQKGQSRKFSRLVMGTDHLVQANWTKKGQAKLNQQKVSEILNEAAKLGINFFDTSPIYVGGVEYRLGKWIKLSKDKIKKDEFYYNKNSNPDRKLYVLSKGGFPFDLYYSKKLEPGIHSKRLKQELKKQGIIEGNLVNIAENKKAILLKNVPPGTYASRLYGNEEQIKTRVAGELKHSCQNLGCNITVYLMHRDDGDYIKFNEVVRDKTPVKTIMRALSSPRISKAFLLLGWSNWKTHRIQESLKLSKKYPNLTKPVINSPYFSLFEMTSRTIHAGGVQVTHEEMMDPNFQKGIKIMPYSPLGGFSILDKPEPKWENAKKAAKKKYDDGDPYWKNVYYAIFTPANKARYHRVVKFTDTFNKKNKTNYTVDQMINAYVLAHPRTDLLAIGPRTIPQLRRTVASLKLSRMLTKKDLDYLYYGF